MGGFYYVLAEVAGGGDRAWVAEHHLETLLVYRMLALGHSDFLLAGVAGEGVLQVLVWHEAWSKNKRKLLYLYMF